METPPPPPPLATASTTAGSTFLRSLIAGALAGTTVDVSLYPLDTLKTRLQSASGFWAAGGFRGIYNGIGSAAVGSAPGAALFFITYDSTKSYLTKHKHARDRTILGDAGTHMLAGSLGEIAACAVRVPTEVVKQRAQAGLYPTSLQALKSILAQRRPYGSLHVWRELYRGWTVTVMREVPFTVIQFPLWEALKRWSLERRAATGAAAGVRDVGAIESALYGSASGAVAAGLTTPLDVLKTRLMLAKEKQNAAKVFLQIWRDEGPRALFSGVGPRTMWISIGGAVFLGSYQWASNLMAELQQGDRPIDTHHLHGSR